MHCMMRMTGFYTVVARWTDSPLVGLGGFYTRLFFLALILYPTLVGYYYLRAYVLGKEGLL